MDWKTYEKNLDRILERLKAMNSEMDNRNAIIQAQYQTINGLSKKLHEKENEVAMLKNDVDFFRTALSGMSRIITYLAEGFRR